MKTARKRLDGKKKLISLTSDMEARMRLYRREKGIESESELVRQAIVKFIEPDSYDDATLKLQGLQDLRRAAGEIRDMAAVIFSYLRRMHTNLLAYHPEIDPELKDAALSSATSRHEKFFAAFREALRDDPPFFERLLHTYVTGETDGAP